MDPGITIAVPNRNNERYLAECLSAISLQSQRPARIIVSDNHSTDGSRKIIESFKAYVDRILEPPRFLDYMEHLYWLLHEVTTEYVVFTAGDDFLHRDLVRLYSRHLQRFPGSAFVCSPFYYVEDHSRLISKMEWPDSLGLDGRSLKDVFLNGPICNVSSVAWNTAELRKVPVLPLEMGNCVDWYFYIALSSRGRVGLVRKKLLYYRTHAASTGASNVRAHTEKCKHMFAWVKENSVVEDYNAQIFAAVTSNFEKVLQQEDLSAEVKPRTLPLFERMEFRAYAARMKRRMRHCARAENG